MILTVQKHSALYTYTIIYCYKEIQMRTDYHTKLKPVIRFLEQNYNVPLNLEEVAKLAALSPYHFHRVFKSVTGETLNEFLRRLRLQKAAHDLFYNKPPIIDVALEQGFSSSQNFAKAFRKHFDLSPSEVRECTNLTIFSQVLRKSKIGTTHSKNGNDLVESTSYNSSHTTQRRINMIKQQFDQGTLAYVRVTGPYGENYKPALDALYGWASSEGVADATCIFIYHDNPEITPAEKCRTDIGLLVPENVEVAGAVEKQPFVGGTYATLRKQITDMSQYGPAWNEHIAQIVDLGIEMGDGPCFELYHSFNPETNESDVSFCSSIR
jgi:AraC family transcriptional regulator